jgi:hypothetical protein
MRVTALAAASVWLAMAGTAAASPGDLGPRPGSDDAPVAVLEGAGAPSCAMKSGLCLQAGAHSTLAVASAPVAAAIGGERPGKAPPVVPRFERAAAAEGSSSASGPWTLALAANLKKAAWNGNALFLFFDLEDPQAVETKQVTALYQAPIKAGSKLAARVTLAPDDGFRAGHTYRIRVVQLINGKEVVLTEGDVALQ